MPDLPISGLPAAGALAAGNLTVIVQAGVTVRSTVGAESDFTVNTTIPGQAAAGALTGAESVLIYQGGAPVLTTTQDIADLAPAGGNIGMPYIAGRFYGGRGAAVNAGTVAAADTVFWQPYQADSPFTLAQLATRTGNTNAVAGNLLLGLYADNGAGVPGALIVGTGAIAVAATANTNYAAAAVSAAQPAGVYWLASLTSAAIQWQCLNNNDPYVSNLMGGSSMQTVAGGGNPFTGYSVANAFGLGLPATGAGAATTIARFAFVGIVT